MSFDSKNINVYGNNDKELVGQNKPTCFFIVSRVPFPPVGGDKLKYFNMIEILKMRYKISMVIISDEKVTPEMKEYLDNSGHEYKIFSYSRLRFKLNAIKAFFSTLPLQVGYYYFGEVHEYCRKNIKREDFVMANLIRTALYVQDLPNKKFIDVADSIYLNYIRSIDRVSSFFWRTVYSIEIKRLQGFEQKCVANFDASLFANWSERNYYSDFGRAIWIPNGVSSKLLETNYFRRKKSLFPEVVFFGKMDYQPNIDAVNWLISKVLPLVPSLKIRIIGGSPHPKIKALGKRYSNSVVIEGFVKDPYQAMYDATAVVAPMQTGGGIQNKILEAMAIGAIVLTTTLGAKAIIGAVSGEHLIICDEPQDYATAIMELHNNSKNSIPMGLKAKKLMKESFTWDLYAKKLYEVLDEASFNKIEQNNKTAC
ncbi:glycosyltransferase [Segetibacter aerophilus]|uniref:Glycosyl transferase family 1 n=1 Tax=Segetibacter aerophilus TaxID=670293 RepID=A0A512BI16_9BACT|nr:glycosyltransferase [Segetibacter aerophilus]GEO11629.1 glycosyl transferase family 1 [Segetibacter aerophilus]